MPHLQSMASGDLLITLCRVGSFRAGRHGDHDAQTSFTLDCIGGAVLPVARAMAWWQSIQQVAISGGGAGYTGPGDVNGAAVAWGGLRGFSAAYSTGAILLLISLIRLTQTQ
jgi:hypothetical protein